MEREGRNKERRKEKSNCKRGKRRDRGRRRDSDKGFEKNETQKEKKKEEQKEDCQRREGEKEEGGPTQTQWEPGMSTHSIVLNPQPSKLDIITPTVQMRKLRPPQVHTAIHLDDSKMGHDVSRVFKVHVPATESQEKRQRYDGK